MKLDLSKILNTILLGDVLKQMRLLPDNCIDCIICSPPYWQLRSYGWDGEWGLEPTYQQYLDNLIAFMSESKRVLKPTGTIWINLGDSYGSVHTGGKPSKKSCLAENMEKAVTFTQTKAKTIDKSLLLLPHRFAIRCVDELGLILRNDIIWAKRNGMPESVTDRFSKKHEFIFFFTKSQKYFFDLDGIRDVAITGNGTAFGVNTKKRGGGDAVVGTPISNHTLANHPGGKNPGDVQRFWDGFKDMPYDEYMQMCHDYFHNPDDCWDINTKPSSHNHYASYNSELIDKPIIAGCPEFVCNKCGKPREKIIKNNIAPKSTHTNTKVTEDVAKKYGRDKGFGQKWQDWKNNNPATVEGFTDCGCSEGFSPGIVLDPFCGTGTTLKRAKQLGRNVIGIEGKKEYVDLANKIFSTVENRLF